MNFSDVCDQILTGEFQKSDNVVNMNNFELNLIASIIGYIHKEKFTLKFVGGFLISEDIKIKTEENSKIIEFFKKISNNYEYVNNEHIFYLKNYDVNKMTLIYLFHKIKVLEFDIEKMTKSNN